MIPSESQPGQSSVAAQAEQIRVDMQRIERRQWWLWTSAVLVILVLALGIASFALPGLIAQAETLYSYYLTQAVRGLVGLVLLFSLYTVYQQLQIHRIQRQMTEQVVALSKMEERTEEVYKLAALDPLTGLYNRRSGEQRLAEEVTRSRRHSTPLTVLMLDVDGLKDVNDTFGHAAGDELLKHFAQRLNKAIRGSDVAVRMGGDEFQVLLPECKPDEVQHVLNRLGGLKINLGAQEITMTCSAGWANYMPDELPEQLLRRADDALYLNKRSWKKDGKQTIAPD